MSVGKAIALKAWTRSQGSRKLRLLEFLEISRKNRHMNMVSLSALRTG